MVTEVLVLHIGHIQESSARGLLSGNELDRIALLVLAHQVEAEENEEDEGGAHEGDDELEGGWVVVFLLLGQNGDWCDTIGDGIGDPDETGGDGFLGMAGSVGRHEGENHDIGGREGRHHIETPTNC